MGKVLPQDEIATLIAEFESIRADMVRLVDESGDLLTAVHDKHRVSARNLLHYLALRSHDLRPLQTRLGAAGLSSLGRAESHVLPEIDAVRAILFRLAGISAPDVAPAPDGPDLAEGQRLLDSHTAAVLGPKPEGRGVAIMVTMPTQAADDYRLVADLLKAGMDVMRINCAHDSSDEWGRMIGHLRRAEQQHGRPCRILMDLAGPKIRTGPLEP